MSMSVTVSYIVVCNKAKNTSVFTLFGNFLEGISVTWLSIFFSNFIKKKPNCFERPDDTKIQADFFLAIAIRTFGSEGSNKVN